MEVKIYEFKLDAKKGEHELTPTYLGFVETESFVPEEIFHLCNWSEWCNYKPSNLHADIDVVGHGLLIVNPKTKEEWLTKSVGWFKGTHEEILDYVKENANQFLWI